MTYLWVELLADSSLWRPEQSNATYRLDLADLLSVNPEAVALDDAEVHPLRKLAWILSDLETWHRKQRQPEAAFAANLERSQRLWGSFNEDADQQTITQHLEERLDDLGRRYEWWSMGMARLAERLRASGEDQLVEARRVALEGAEAHPDSPGGKHCRHIVAGIEAPAYELSAMASDSPNRRSLLIQHRNLSTVHLRAYALDLVSRVESAKERNLLPAYQDVPPILAANKPVAEWSVDLPETPDYRRHRTFVTPPMTQPGLYLVVVSARQDFAQDFNQQTAVSMIMGDLVLLTRTDETGVEVTARSGESGRTLAEVELDLYRHDYRKGHTRVERRTTGADGTAHFETTRLNRGNHFLVARHGKDVALAQNVQRAYRHNLHDPPDAALIYTDRSIYRPQQTLHWKVVAYGGGGEKSRYRLLPKTDVTITLMDANGQQVAASAVTTNTFGSASGSFEIPGGRLLGGWTLQSSLPGSTSVQVEEYKRPTFEVTVSDPTDALRLN